MDIIFEDDSILVVNKPAGLATQTKDIGSRDLESECRKYLKRKGEKPEIYVVHRLDQPVSGLTVLAKTAKAAAVLSKGMRDDDYSKDYRAVVFTGGRPVAGGRLENYLKSDAKGNFTSVTDKDDREGKRAVLDFEVESTDDNTATLSVHLHTGRHHQIRAQLAAAGMPITGDLKYGTPESIAYSKKAGISTISLCACHLSFTHPVTGEKLEYSV